MSRFTPRVPATLRAPQEWWKRLEDAEFFGREMSEDPFGDNDAAGRFFFSPFFPCFSLFFPFFSNPQTQASDASMDCDNRL